MDPASHPDVTRQKSPRINAKLSAYLTAAGAAAGSSEATGAIVANTTPQAFGVNGEVNIDFNSDGQIDFQIDHDRVNVMGADLDFLQIDKNDASSAADPLPIDVFATFPLNGTAANADVQYLAFDNEIGDQGGYPVALKEGDVIGTLGSGMGKGLLEGTRFDFQEGANFLGGGTTIRANRLIDEDRGQVDQALQPTEPLTLPFGRPADPTVPDFVGLGGEVRYLGVRLDLNDALFPNTGGMLNNNDTGEQFVHGWIGIRIDNEADATGTVTGWAYETTPGMPINAGDTGLGTPGDFNQDGKADGTDFLVWQRQFGGALGGDDLATWQGAFGSATLAAQSSGLSAAHSVPEPTALFSSLLGCTLAITLLWKRRH